MNQKSPCPKCGSPKNIDAEICRKCYYKNRAENARGRKKHYRKRVPCESCNGAHTRCDVAKKCHWCARQSESVVKKCFRCEVALNDSNWNKGCQSRSVFICKKCQNERGAESYNKSTREKRRKKAKDLHYEIMNAYGGKCECCGESRIDFLSLDHTLNDGAKHRKKLGNKVYAWLKENGYPQDGFRCLCMNCNWGRMINKGVCPHKESRMKYL